MADLDRKAIEGRRAVDLQDIAERLQNIRQRGQDLEDWKAQAVTIIQALQGRVATLENQAQNLNQRVTTLEQRLTAAGIP